MSHRAGVEGASATATDLTTAIEIALILGVLFSVIGTAETLVQAPISSTRFDGGFQSFSSIFSYTFLWVQNEKKKTRLLTKLTLSYIDTHKNGRAP